MAGGSRATTVRVSASNAILAPPTRTSVMARAASELAETSSVYAPFAAVRLDPRTVIVGYSPNRSTILAALISPEESRRRSGSVTVAAAFCITCPAGASTPSVVSAMAIVVSDAAYRVRPIVHAAVRSAATDDVSVVTSSAVPVTTTVHPDSARSGTSIGGAPP